LRGSPSCSTHLTGARLPKRYLKTPTAARSLPALHGAFGCMVRHPELPYSCRHVSSSPGLLARGSGAMAWWKVLLLLMLFSSTFIVWFLHRSGRHQP